MRRKTVDEFRRQALGSKNEKNFGSGQLPAYLDVAKCSLPAHTAVQNTPDRKKALALPKSGLFDKKQMRFDMLSQTMDMRVFRQTGVKAGAKPSTLFTAPHLVSTDSKDKMKSIEQCN